MAARYGNGGSRGRRITDAEDEPLTDEGCKISDVGKAARHYDPEHRRQRRLGVAEAGLLGGGAALIGLGTRGAIKTTKGVRALAHPPGGTVFRSKEEADAYNKTKKATGGALAIGRKRDVAAIGTGAAAVGGAGLVRDKAENRKNGIWR